MNHPRLKVVEDTVKLPSGKKTDYLRFEKSGTAPTAIVENEEKKFLVVREYFYVTNEWFFLLPGGYAEGEEESEVGIRRELEEETGVEVGELNLIGSFYSDIRRCSVQVPVFWAKKLFENDPKPDDEEQIEKYWMSEEEIDQLIKEDKFRNSFSLAAWAVFKCSKFSAS